MDAEDESLEEELARELAALREEDVDEDFSSLDDENEDLGLAENANENVFGDVTEDGVSTEEMSALSALRAQMKSRLEDCDLTIRECDEALTEAKLLDEKSDKRAMKK